MASKLQILKDNQDQGEIAAYAFYCPGCRHYHVYYVKEQYPGCPVWAFNGDMQRPTFTPSLLNTLPAKGDRCHLFVKEGRIEFLGDCSHDLAGQTVEMQDEE
jgi:hypothetical protein